MGQHDALGQAGRAAGVGQRDQIRRRVDVHRRRLTGRRPQLGVRRGPIGSADHDHLAHGRHLAGRRKRPLQERWHRHEQAGVAVVQLRGKLVGRVQRVDGGGNPTQDRHGVEHDRVFGQVRAVHTEHVALAEAARSQPGRDPTHVRGELPIAERPPARGIDQRGLVAQLLCSAEHQLGEGDVRNLQVGPRATVDDRRTRRLDYHAGNLPTLSI